MHFPPKFYKYIVLYYGIGENANNFLEIAGDYGRSRIYRETAQQRVSEKVLLRVESCGRAHTHEMDKIASERAGKFGERRFGVVSKYGALKFSRVVKIRKENRALIERVHFGNSFAIGFANRREVAFTGIFGCKDVQKRSERRRGIA